MTIVGKLAARIARITPSARLGLALSIAAIVHAIIILGVGFEFEPNKTAPALDVVLVRTATDQAPRDARYLAQADSQAGDMADSKLPPGGPAPAQAPSQLESPDRKPLVQTRADYQMPYDLGQLSEAMNAGESRASLNSQLAQLVSALAKDARRYAERSRVQYLESVSAKSAAEAAYVKAWTERVESVGNAHYPIAAVKRELSGRVILHVLLNSEGDVMKAFIGSPSGRPVLDTAAMRIVRLAAPFKPFSGDMRKTYDQLMITRTWTFESEGRLATR